MKRRRDGKIKEWTDSESERERNNGMERRRD